MDRSAYCLSTDFSVCIVIIAFGFIGVYEYCMFCYISWTLVASSVSLFPVLRDTIKTILYVSDALWQAVLYAGVHKSGYSTEQLVFVLK